ncbi:MAG: type IV pilin protein [Stagnimonas sp.]|nr:type IV pilin protein [Stagnimonas sp.]
MKTPITAPSATRPLLKRRGFGFTLIEVIVAVAIVGILATIAIPSYTKSIAKTKRRTAQVCLSSFATQMERYYTTNLRYCVDTTPADGTCDSTVFTLPGLDCASTANSGNDYTYSAAVDSSTYTLTATPKTGQSTRDAVCGTLTLDQAGTRTASGTGGVPECW